MSKQLSLSFITFCLSMTVFMGGCSSHSSQTLESLETRLSALEDTQYNFQARQESLNEWESKRITALESKHPDITVPPPLPFIARETIRTGASTGTASSLQAGATDVTSGDVVAPSALVATPASSQGVQIYRSPASTDTIVAQPLVTSTPIHPMPTGHPASPQPMQTAQPASVVAIQPIASAPVVTGQAQIEALGGKPIDPNAPVATLKPAKTPKASPSSGGEKGVYARALAQIERRQSAQGRASMDSFMAKYPSSSLMPNALYWKGETFYSEKNYGEAVINFQDVMSRYPKSDKTPDAMLKIGMSYQKMGDTQNAKFYLQLLLDDYPTARSASIAKRQLANLP